MAEVNRILFFFLAALALASGDFIPPADGPVPFRRDKLPLDVETMSSLSRQLTTLARKTELSDPAKERAVAQMLAVAIALDPANRAARDLGGRIAAGEKVRNPPENGARSATGRAWNLLGWLEQPEAGEDGQALGACLGDALAKVDPQHPKATAWLSGGERGQWAGWVKPLEAFEPQQAEPPVMADVVPPEAPSQVASLKLPVASTRVPIWYFDPKTKMDRCELIEVSMAASVAEGRREFEIQLPGEKMGPVNQRLTKLLPEILKERHGSLPKGVRIQITLPIGITYPLSRNGLGICGAVVVLADAAFTGKPPAATVLATVTPEGKLGNPPCLWETLRQLTDQEVGGRLILPELAAEFLPPLLTLDQAEFFLKFEVLLAGDAQALCDLASADPEDRIKSGNALFKRISDARGSRTLGSFLTFESTQGLLSDVVREIPEHASARMLKMRGTSKWPSRLPRGIYAREVRASLDPVTKQMRLQRIELTPDQLREAEDLCRERLEVVDRLEESVDDRQELQLPALNTAKLLGALANDFRRHREDQGTMNRRLRETYASFVETINGLTDVVGDRETYPLPQESF